jgi:NADH:ubiquinone oxidoreductase subunit E
MEKEKIKKIVSKHRHEKAAILAILHEIQSEDNQLETESLNYIAQLLKVPVANVYGLATFYSAFSLGRKGDTKIRVCSGISCHINGADEVIEVLESKFNLEMGETTWDEKFSLEQVHCLGLCSIGPNVAFNTNTYSKLNKERMETIIEILYKRTGDSK